MKKIHKKLIIFDLDGTLIDSAFDLANSLNYTLAEFDLPPLPFDEISKQVGNGVSMIINRSLGPDMEHRYVDALKTFIRHYEKHMLDTTLPYPGVRDSLKEHRDSFTFALLTNKPLYHTEKILQDLDLHTFFDIAIGGDSLERKKPDPDGVFNILDRTFTTVDKAVLVGDSINDVLAGRNSGIEVVGVAYGIGAEDFKHYPPDHLIDTFRELFELVHPI